jgi:iron complex outermembrane receptor protein
VAPDFIFPSVGSTTQNLIGIRGIFQDIANPGISSGVSEYIDGVYTGRNISFDADIGDVQRVEILYGPQGTLFGKNTIAGAINITTIQPGPNFGGDIEAEAGSWDLLHVKGSVNLPVIKDMLSIRLSGEYETRDGYVNEVVAGGPKGGNINLGNGRAQILFKYRLLQLP